MMIRYHFIDSCQWSLIFVVDDSTIYFIKTDENSIQSILIQVFTHS